MKKVIGTQLMVLSVVLVLISGVLLWAKKSSNNLSFFNYTAQATSSYDRKSELGIPSRLRISSVGIDLDIFPATIHGNTWESTFNGVSHLSTTPFPGEAGNSVLYGHNWESLLGPLTEVNVYDTIEVMYDQGEVKKFKVVDVRTVSSNEISILDQTEDIRLTVYTCSGFLDTKRFVVTALAVQN